jgi:hypothetical protein
MILVMMMLFVLVVMLFVVMLRCRDNRADNSCSRHNIADRRDKAHRCNIVMAVGFSLSSAL